MSEYWIVVADASRARLFTSNNPGLKLKPLEQLDHPEGRLHQREIYSDVPGRGFSSQGCGRYALEMPNHSRQERLRPFIRQITSLLDEGERTYQFRRLILVAPPAFLGQLRQYLSHRLRECVYRELPLDLTHQEPAEIARSLKRHQFS